MNCKSCTSKLNKNITVPNVQISSPSITPPICTKLVSALSNAIISQPQLKLNDDDKNSYPVVKLTNLLIKGLIFIVMFTLLNILKKINIHYKLTSLITKLF